VALAAALAEPGGAVEVGAEDDVASE